MRYSIIIPTYNRATDMTRCLASVAMHTTDYEIIWVDDASDKKEYDTIARYLQASDMPYHRIIHERNQGFIFSVNDGLRYALARESVYIIILNSDTVVYDGWADRLSHVLEKNGRCGAVGPLTSGFDVQSPQRIDMYYDHAPRGLWDTYVAAHVNEDEGASFAQQISQKYHHSNIETCERLSFFCVMLRAESVKDIGILSEEYGTGYYEDDDYCERVLRAGWQLRISCDVYVHHALSKSFAQKYGAKKWKVIAPKIAAHNKELFEKKYHYGSYADPLMSISDQRVYKIRAFRDIIALKHALFLQKEHVRHMEQSVFWKARALYVRFKQALMTIFRISK